MRGSNDDLPVFYLKLDFVGKAALFQHDFGDANSLGITHLHDSCFHRYNVITEIVKCKEFILILAPTVSTVGLNEDKIHKYVW